MPATEFNLQPAHLVGPLVPGILFGFHKPRAQTKPSFFDYIGLASHQPGVLTL